MQNSILVNPKPRLEELLSAAENGNLQLPDFQRPWVWNDERIKNLLASVSADFPIGAVMLLQSGGKHTRFKPRPLAGTQEHLCKNKPEALILDGQQRLTSLYSALKSTIAVKTKDTKNKPISRWYYIDMKKAILPEADQEDGILSIPEDRLLKTSGGVVTQDVTKPEYEYEKCLFPTNQIFNSAEWRQEYSEYWNFDKNKMRLFNNFERDVIKRFEQYQVPVITLGKETPKEAVCLVFERVNTGGVSLTVFELLTASFAAENFLLRKDWDTREERLKNKYPVLDKLQSDDFLQAISLLVTQRRRRIALDNGLTMEKIPGISCKRREILRLEVADWKQWAHQVEEGFKRAARFLHAQKIFNAHDLPYRTQLVPLAAIFTSLGNDGNNEGAQQKIAQWYWCGVLGELYGGAIESRFAHDLPEVVAMVHGESVEPKTIADSSFQALRLLTLRTRNSAAYKGIHALLMRDGCCDFCTGETIESQTVFDDKIDIHHIFPKKWCENVDITSDIYNSIINKTAISARTNRKIGSSAPSEYIPLIEKEADIDSERMNEILTSHCILPDYLRTDNFKNFYKQRAEFLLKRIEKATGKQITREKKMFDEALS